MEFLHEIDSWLTKFESEGIKHRSLKLSDLYPNGEESDVRLSSSMFDKFHNYTAEKMIDYLREVLDETVFCGKPREEQLEAKRSSFVVLTLFVEGLASWKEYAENRAKIFEEYDIESSDPVEISKFDYEYRRFENRKSCGHIKSDLIKMTIEEFLNKAVFQQVAFSPGKSVPFLKNGKSQDDKENYDVSVNDVDFENEEHGDPDRLIEQLALMSVELPDNTGEAERKSGYRSFCDDLESVVLGEEITLNSLKSTSTNVANPLKKMLENSWKFPKNFNINFDSTVKFDKSITSQQKNEHDVEEAMANGSIPDKPILRSKDKKNSAALSTMPDEGEIRQSTRTFTKNTNRFDSFERTPFSDDDDEAGTKFSRSSELFASTSSVLTASVNCVKPDTCSDISEREDFSEDEIEEDDELLEKEREAQSDSEDFNRATLECKQPHSFENKLMKSLNRKSGMGAADEEAQGKLDYYKELCKHFFNSAGPNQDLRKLLQKDDTIEECEQDSLYEEDSLEMEGTNESIEDETTKHDHYEIEERDGIDESMSDTFDRSGIENSHSRLSTNTNNKIGDSTFSRDDFLSQDISRSDNRLSGDSEDDTLTRVSCSSGMSPERYVKKITGIIDGEGLEEVEEDDEFASSSEINGDLVYRKFIGKGAEARVYQGYMGKNRESVVAIKKYELEEGTDEGNKLYQNLKKEFLLFKSLAHPALVQYLAFKKLPRNRNPNLFTLNLVMEYAPGGCLATEMRKHKDGLSLIRVKSYVLQILLGLQYLHRQKIVHRDLKPGNILLTKDLKNVKISDFGISAEIVSQTQLRRTSIGTPWYMAPEVILGEPYSYGADVWALGSCVFEMVTGKKIFNQCVAMGAMMKIVQSGNPLSLYEEERERFLKQDPSLVDFLNLCWEKDSAKRATSNELLTHEFLHDAPLEL
eukprot:CAMPEP_0115000668 /NCGR_PEP_ID=MMETSP0216-20121206/16897_1 /TAXON_ID=223996 /ORGANISM="Protocruzia adherens, Strain Boccale" /LENGTH=921 /DNA_ID=CAMNT_0002365815 /DNA_START=176 /DNA_END=2941 /DNA_ORIENTATION=-